MGQTTTEELDLLILGGMSEDQLRRFKETSARTVIESARKVALQAAREAADRIGQALGPNEIGMLLLGPVLDGAVASLEQAARGLSGGAIADDIARALAPRLRALVRSLGVPLDDEFVDQDAGLFEREMYLRLARKDAFPNRKVGKKRIARWGDVKSALLKAGVPVTVAEPTNDPEADLLNEIRQRAGLAVKGGR